MFGSRASGTVRTNRPPIGAAGTNGPLVLGLMALASLAVSYVLLSRLGIQLFSAVLIGIVVGVIYLFLSFRSLAIPFYIAVLSIGGFRFLLNMQVPMLPDLYLDRLMVLWLLIVFMIKFFAEGRRFKGPYALDIALLVHGTYIFMRIWAYGFEVFTPWTQSILVPYMVYFFAKNIIETKRQLQILYVLLLLVGFYYSVSSIAQKFHIDAILYPTYMRLPSVGWPGRSSGPYNNPGIFGNVLGMILPINLYFLSILKSRPWRAALMVNVALCFLGLYFTYTRGAWICTAAGLFVVVLLNRKSYLKALTPLAVVVPILGIVFLGLGQDKFMKERVENEDTIGARLGTMVTALRVWRDHPFLGCGSYRYAAVRGQYIEPVNVPGFPTIQFVQFRNNSAHDMYLGPLAEDGLVGVGLMFLIYFLNARNLFRIYRRARLGDRFAIYIIPLFAGVMVSYLVGGITQSFRHAAIMGTMLLMTAGIAAGYDPEKYESRVLVED